MLIVISPAKTLDYQSATPTDHFSQPRLLSHSNELIQHCRQLSASQLKTLMKISDQLAQLNVARFRHWHSDFNLENARQAIFAFKGDVYAGLDAYTLTPPQLDFAQHHLRILSGLYGLLRPLDLMMPYRLEMGTQLNNQRGSNLYQFWDHLITDMLKQDIQEQQDNILINLASDEYYKVIDEKRLNMQIIKPVFLDQKNGKYKVISFYAKKARGLMSRFILQHQLTQPEQLQAFDVDGYYFDKTNSTATEFVFKRDEQ